jgi:hypothetical protein
MKAAKRKLRNSRLTSRNRRKLTRNPRMKL